MEPARHVFRVLLLLLLVVTAVVLGRSLLVPRSYGLYGSYRHDNVAEQMRARPPLHGGAASCVGCHGERAKVVAAGAHRAVSCEVCHGPLGLHVKADARTSAMPVDRTPALCAHCHRKIDGRPERFPQIALAQHQGGVENVSCLDCHDPHTPKP